MRACVRLKMRLVRKEESKKITAKQDDGKMFFFFQFLPSESSEKRIALLLYPS